MNLSIRLLTIFRSLTASVSSSICDTCAMVIEETLMKTITVMIMTIIIIMILMMFMMIITTIMMKTMKTMTTTTMTSKMTFSES